MPSAALRTGGQSFQGGHGRSLAVSPQAARARPGPYSAFGRWASGIRSVPGQGRWGIDSVSSWKLAPSLGASQVMVQKPRFSLGGHMGGAGRQPRFAPILAPTRQLLARHSSFEWMDAPDMQCGSAIVALGVVVGVNASPGVSRCPCETNLIGGRVLPGGSVRRLQRTTLMVVLHSGGATCGAALDSRLLLSMLSGPSGSNDGSLHGPSVASGLRRSDRWRLRPP